MSIASILPEALTVGFLIACFFALPNLKLCALSDESAASEQNEAARSREMIFISLLTVVYAAAAFFHLGNTASPQSFLKSSAETETLFFAEERSIDRIFYFSGINTGSVRFEASADGEQFTVCAESSQDYASLLKWREITLPEAVSAKMLRVSTTGDAWVGEVAVYSGEERLTLSGGVLCDEQELIPAEESFLNSSYFDEIYHARTAIEHMEELPPYECSHPPLGKIILSLGIALFGITPFGWRFMGTLFGVLMLPLMYAFLRKLFRGKYVPLCAAVLFASDFMHFVQTRIATIDTYAVFFTIAMYYFFYCFASGKTKHPRLALALSGVFFGIGAASKWTCIYAGAGLGVLWLGYWVLRFADAKKNGDNRMETARELFRQILFCMVFFVAVPAAIYYVSYAPYGPPRGMHGIGMFFRREYAEMVWSNQQFMFSYHSGVTATHPYSSRWYQWMLDIRPILYYLKYYPDGTRASFGAFVNPVLCWGGLLSLFVLGYLAFARCNRKAAFLLVGYLAQLVPWMFVSRVVFFYHYFPCTIFLTLSMGYMFELYTANGKETRSIPLLYAAVSVLLFVMFYPALSGSLVSQTTKLLKWLPTWPF